ncbi:uncharacterized protein TNCV_1936791 [Trichonephila clavipes]|nr:uncharacterized protein TNCV_1936791 [Trichonephila clavipes]
MRITKHRFRIRFPTLLCKAASHCNLPDGLAGKETGGRREPAPINLLVLPLSLSPKRHCCRISAAGKGCRVYPLDSRPDAVALYSGCTPGKHRAWFVPDDRDIASFVGLRGRWRNARTMLCTRSYGSNAGVQGSPTLPQTIKAGYLNCKILPYIPNPLHCFKRFGHSKNSCRGQLTCSRCASVGYASTDCILELKCISCSQAHSADSKLCPKWRTEKEIQVIKTNKNISYPEVQKLIVPQKSQTYAQVAKTSTATKTTQTDETITKIVCPPLKLLQPLISVPKPSTRRKKTYSKMNT